MKNILSSVLRQNLRFIFTHLHPPRSRAADELRPHGQERVEHFSHSGYFGSGRGERCPSGADGGVAAGVAGCCRQTPAARKPLNFRRFRTSCGCCGCLAHSHRPGRIIQKTHFLPTERLNTRNTRKLTKNLINSSVFLLRVLLRVLGNTRSVERQAPRFAGQGRTIHP